MAAEGAVVGRVAAARVGGGEGRLHVRDGKGKVWHGNGEGEGDGGGGGGRLRWLRPARSAAAGYRCIEIMPAEGGSKITDHSQRKEGADGRRKGASEKRGSSRGSRAPRRRFPPRA